MRFGHWTAEQIRCSRGLADSADVRCKKCNAGGEVSKEWRTIGRIPGSDYDGQVRPPIRKFIVKFAHRRCFLPHERDHPVQHVREQTHLNPQSSSKP